MVNNKLAVISQAEQSVIAQGNSNRLRKLTLLDLSADEFIRLQALADWYAVSSFNPKQNGKAQRSSEDYKLIMLKGMELGFSPMAAVDMISIINGKPTIDGKGMLAIIYASGEAEDVKIVGDAEKCTVTIQRKGYKSPFTATFTIKDAENMGLKDRDQYKKQPKTMLKWRAVAACAREAFPDFLGGLYTIEEIASHSVSVFEDGTMQLLQLPANIAPQLEAPKRDIEDVDKMIFGNEESAPTASPEKLQAAWTEQLKDIIAPMYKNDFHLNNGVKAALANAEINFDMSLDKAAVMMFKHRCASEWGIADDELSGAIAGAFGQEGLRGYLAEHPRDYKGAWQLMSVFVSENIPF